MCVSVWRTWENVCSLMVRSLMLCSELAEGWIKGKVAVGCSKDQAASDWEVSVDTSTGAIRSLQAITYTEQKHKISYKSSCQCRCSQIRVSYWEMESILAKFLVPSPFKLPSQAQMPQCWIVKPHGTSSPKQGCEEKPFNLGKDANHISCMTAHWKATNVRSNCWGNGWLLRKRQASHLVCQIRRSSQFSTICIIVQIVETATKLGNFAQKIAFFHRILFLPQDLPHFKREIHQI